MKNRVLSLVLAVLMVVSMAAVFSFSASATEGLEGLTVTVGTAYAAPGTNAAVDIYVSATALPENYLRLRNWQFNFAGAAIVTDNTGFYVSGGSAFGTFNLDDNMACLSADAGYGCGEAANFLAKGGFKIATLYFAVPADAEGEIELSVSEVVALSFEDADFVAYNEKANATLVAGKIIVGETGTADAVVGTGDDYVVPKTNAAGERVVSILDDDGYGVLTGDYHYVTIPACVTTVEDSFLDLDSIAGVILKNTEYTDVDAKSVAATGSSADPTVVYLHKKSGAADTEGTYGAFAGLAKRDAQKVTVKNILGVYENVAVEGNKVTFVTGLAINDLDYKNLTVSLDFGTKKIEKTVTGVYKTIVKDGKIYASTDEATGTADGAYAEGFALLTGLSVNGVPAGTYDVTVTLYGTTENASGSYIVVTSDPVTVSVTVA